MLYKEDNATVLEFLSRGYSSSYSGEPVAQAVGNKFFTLLELVPRDGVVLNLSDVVYIGPEERKDIKFIKGRITYNDLTQTAKSELTPTVEKLIQAQESRFVEFFNKAGSISIRKHSLELLPSIGKKHMQSIIDERETKPFKSFADIASRVSLLPDPARIIQERVVEELEGNDIKYYLFTVPPRKEDPIRRRR